MVIDLQTAGFGRPVQPPYLASLHCSAITCSHHVSNIPLKLWERIIAAGSHGRGTLLHHGRCSPAGPWEGPAPGEPSPASPEAAPHRERHHLLRWPIDSGTSLAPAPPQEGPAAHRVGDVRWHSPPARWDV